MKIFRPEITSEGDDICVSARVETTSCPVSLPDRLWFTFPQKYCDHVTGDINGFAATLLPLAMTLGEDLYMEGALSPRLLSGMEEYQRLQCAWSPTPFLPVKLKAESLQPDSSTVSAGTGVGCSFSGGIDSAYTLWRHLPENEKNPFYRISHCLMINGFDGDSDIEKPGDFFRIEKTMQAMMDRIGVEFIVCRTNHMAFSDPWIQKETFAAMVTAPAMVLGGLFSTFYIPSSLQFNNFLRNGSHPILDHLIATETMETIHDASHLKRTDKTRVISGWSETYTTLRVCSGQTGYDKQTNSIQNCGRCEKCIRTMKTLELYDGLNNFKTFPKKVSRLKVWLCHLDYQGPRTFTKEIISEAYRLRRFGIMIDYCLALVFTRLFAIPRAVLWRIRFHINMRSEAYAKKVRRIPPRLGRKTPTIK